MRSGPGCVPERTNLDRMGDGFSGLRGPRERSVEVLSLDDVEAAEMLLRLSEGAIGGQDITAGHTYDRGGVGAMKGAAEDVRSGRPSSPLQES